MYLGATHITNYQVPGFVAFMVFELGIQIFSRFYPGLSSAAKIS